MSAMTFDDLEPVIAPVEEERIPDTRQFGKERNLEKRSLDALRMYEKLQQAKLKEAEYDPLFD